MKNPVKSTGQDTVSVTKQKSKGYIDFEDTLTPNGKYLRFYMNENGEAVVEWSKNKRSTNYGKPFGSYNPPWYYCEWENFIGLRSGCGTDCKVLTILPLNEKIEIQSYSDIAIDLENNLVFYAENPAKNLYYVKNIESGLQVKIPVSIQKPEMWGVDSVKFISKNKLYLKWRDENYGTKNVSIHEKIFSMEFLQGKSGNVLNLKENKNSGNSVIEETLIASADSLFNLQNYIEALNMTIDQNTDSLKIEFTLNDIQGLWSCRILEEHEYPAYVVADSPFYWKFINQNIYINGDSLWRLCFPCEIYSGYKIALSNDTIYHYATKERLGFISKDTSKFHIRDNEQFVIDWGNRAFHVDSFGTFNMQKLIRDSLNYSSLLGGMKLITDNQEPGNADPLTFPVKMPLELHIESEEQAKQLCKSKEIYLRIDGRKRKFIVEFIDWSNDDIGFGTVTIDGRYHNPYWRCYPVVRLKPGDWWKGKSFFADYK